MKHFSRKQTLLLKAIRECYAIAPACDRAGVGRTTCYRWLKADANFAEAIEDARQACVDDLEARHVEAAKGKCVISRIHFLKSHRREIYGDQKSEIERRPAPECPPPVVLTAGALALLARGAAAFLAPLVAKAITPEPPPALEPLTGAAEAKKELPPAGTQE
jgi:hypothetical protein